MTPEKRRKPWTAIGKALLTAVIAFALYCGWGISTLIAIMTYDTVQRYAAIPLVTAVGLALLALGVGWPWNLPRPRFLRLAPHGGRNRPGGALIRGFPIYFPATTARQAPPGR